MDARAKLMALAGVIQQRAGQDLADEMRVLVREFEDELREQYDWRGQQQARVDDMHAISESAGESLYAAGVRHVVLGIEPRCPKCGAAIKRVTRESESPLTGRVDKYDVLTCPNHGDVYLLTHPAGKGGAS